MTHVNGFIKAELNFFKNLTETPSPLMPAEFLGHMEDKCFSTSFSVTNVKTNIRFFRKVS